MSAKMETLMTLIKLYGDTNWLIGHGSEAKYMADIDLDGLHKEASTIYEDVRRRIYDLYVEANGGILPG